MGGLAPGHFYEVSVSYVVDGHTFTSNRSITMGECRACLIYAVLVSHSEIHISSCSASLEYCTPTSHGGETRKA